MEEKPISQDKEVQPVSGLDLHAKVVLGLGCLGSLCLACLLGYGSILAAIWILHRLAEG